VRVRGCPASRASQVVRVAEHVVEGHIRQDGHVVNTVHVLDEALLGVRVRLRVRLGVRVRVREETLRTEGGSSG